MADNTADIDCARFTNSSKTEAPKARSVRGSGSISFSCPTSVTRGKSRGKAASTRIDENVGTTVYGARTAHDKSRSKVSFWIRVDPDARQERSVAKEKERNGVEVK